MLSRPERLRHVKAFGRVVTGSMTSQAALGRQRTCSLNQVSSPNYTDHSLEACVFHPTHR